MNKRLNRYFTKDGIHLPEKHARGAQLWYISEVQFKVKLGNSIQELTIQMLLKI